MPRAGATYTLPLSAVVAGAPILATWANPTMNDIAAALTASLCRDGSGGMTGLLPIVDGTAAGPGINFSSDPDTGFYRVGSNAVGVAANGVSVAQFSQAQHLGVAGTAALPGVSFITDPDSGFYSSAANEISLALNGAQVQKHTAGQALFPIGTLALPGMSFLGDPDTGVFSPSANNLRLVVGAAAKVDVSAAGVHLLGATNLVRDRNGALDYNIGFREHGHYPTPTTLSLDYENTTCVLNGSSMVIPADATVNFPNGWWMELYRSNGAAGTFTLDLPGTTFVSLLHLNGGSTPSIIAGTYAAGTNVFIQGACSLKLVKADTTNTWTLTGFASSAL